MTRAVAVAVVIVGLFALFGWALSAAPPLPGCCRCVAP